MKIAAWAEREFSVETQSLISSRRIDASGSYEVRVGETIDVAVHIPEMSERNLSPRLGVSIEGSGLLGRGIIAYSGLIDAMPGHDRELHAYIPAVSEGQATVTIKPAWSRHPDDSPLIIRLNIASAN